MDAYAELKLSANSRQSTRKSPKKWWEFVKTCPELGRRESPQEVQETLRYAQVDKIDMTLKLGTPI